jgi:hypothetical protein
MKSKFSFILGILLITAMVLTACSGQPASASTEQFGTSELIEALHTQGVDAKLGDSIEQAFFSVTGHFVNFSEENVQVFEYESAEAMESDAALVDPDGGSIGTTMVTWVATPHFYKKGQVIVLYIGDNTELLKMFESILGPQFAGR